MAGDQAHAWHVPQQVVHGMQLKSAATLLRHRPPVPVQIQAYTIGVNGEKATQPESISYDFQY